VGTNQRGLSEFYFENGIETFQTGGFPDCLNSFESVEIFREYLHQKDFHPS